MFGENARLTKMIVIIDNMMQLKKNFNFNWKTSKNMSLYVNIDNYRLLNKKITNFQKNQIFSIKIQTINDHNFGGIPSFII